MDVLNAIAKVRFNSARPQRVQLDKGAGYAAELVCLEPGQELTGAGQCGYYVIAGTGVLKAARQSRDLALGHYACCQDGEAHVLANASEQRLICLAISPVG